MLLRGLTRGLAVIGLLFVVVTVMPIDGWLIRLLAGPWNDPAGEILIVPGAENIGEFVGPSSYWRAVYAVRIWRLGGVRKIVLCGAGPAHAMKEFLVCQGVPADAIVTETASTSTRENAVNAARLLAGEPGRKVLMTSDYHMFRAWRAFRKAGLDVAPRPVPDAAKRISAWQFRWSEFVGLCTEGFKTGYYFARGWI